MKYNDVNADFLTKENLSKDADFIDDASTFLYERTGNVYSDPEEVFDEYMEHMRSHDVNEATTVQDLIAVRRMDDATKAKTARLFHTYDKMNMFREDETLVDAVTRFGDYAEGILTAPSTYVSLFTAGAGKAGAVAGQQVAKAAVRKALIKGLSKQGMKRGAAVEGGIGLAQSGLQEATRAEADEDYEFSVGRVAATTGVSTLTGGALGYVGGRSGAKQAVKAERMAQIGAERTARKNQAAVKAAEQTIEKASDATKRPLTKLFVEAGEDARKEMLPGVESALVQLDDATKKRITAAALDVAEKGQLKPLKFADGTEERITETIARGIADGTVDATTFSSVINKYNLTSQQLALLFTADVSRAARTLQQASSVARVQKMAESIGKVTNKGIAEEGDLSRVLKGGFSEADIEDMTNYSRVLSSVGQSAQGFEQLRRGLMTTQLQTTQRNIAGGGMRVFVDEVENLISNSSKAVYKYATGKDVEFSVSTPSMIKYMYNRSEAQVIANAFSSNMPREAQRLFAQFVDAADATSMTGLGGFLAGVGRKANVLNQMSDNYYKKAIFAGQLERLTKAKFGRSVMDLMAKGEMDKITTDMYKNATTKAYELLYQKTPSTKTAAGHLANAYLRIDKQAGVGMLTGLVMPFPRFVFNQVQFMMERAPIIGLLMPAETKIDKAVRQLSGLGMVGGFALYRATQPEGSEWYEYTNERGQTADLRPMLAGLSPFVYMGDLLNRSMSGKLLPKNSKIVQDIQELAVGESLRVGAGSTLFDRIIPESFNALFTDKEMTVATSENLGKLVGDYVATFAYNMPTGLARDGLGLLDEEYAKIVETNGEVRFWDSFVMRATRGLPAPLRDRAINSLSGDTIPIEGRPVIGKAEDTRVETPLSTSITGMNIQAPKSALEKELSRLAMSTYDIYRPNRFGPADVIVRKELGDVLNKESVKIMNSDRYKKLTDNGKRSMLTNRLKNIVNQVQSNAFEQVRKKIRSGEEKRFDEFTVDKFEYETSGKRDDRIQAEEFYRQKFDLPSDYVFKGEDYRGLIEALEVTQKKILRKNKGGLAQSFNEGGAVVGRTRAGQPIYNSGVDDQTKEMISLGLDMAPVTGEIRSAQGAVEDFEQGNYGMAALGALGALPGVGMAGRAAKAGVKALRTVDKAEDIAEAKKILGDEDAIQAWKDTNRLPESQRQKRNPIVQQAAKDLKDGNITGKEYRKIAKAEMPMRPITRENFPEMPTLKEIVGALNKDKSEKGIVGLNVDIPDGTRIGSRLDIPAYDNYDTWIVSLHDGTVRNGKAMGYGQTAVLDNVEFFTEGQGALNIATKKPKAPIARIHGDYKNEDPEAVYNRVYELMDDPEWTQVGMNPFRHSFFYDKATGNPVTRADQVLQVGPLVLAKGARSELSDLKKLKIKSADGKTRVYNEGGLMSPRK